MSQWCSSLGLVRRSCLILKKCPTLELSLLGIRIQASLCRLCSSRGFVTNICSYPRFVSCFGLCGCRD
ncbi:hypothetical protein M6B38_298555 [Iris pallida]|uniref:Uncharacterized protein n=1 Tax=Iris pallida TaxID=29817 RepID=A0AAX6HPS2_IRIPA|nr:hypothetical protein M6B38_298555 [Iris pallida]